MRLSTIRFLLLAALALSLVSPAAGQLQWVAVDTMVNAYGMALSELKPLAYDPASGKLGIVHRGAPTYGSSTALWYNTSTNQGATWMRNTALNPPPYLGVHYPTGAVHNPTSGTSPSSACMVCAGATTPVGQGSGLISGYECSVSLYACTTDTGYFHVPAIWSAGNWVMWACYKSYGGPGSYYLWRTTDYSQVFEAAPPTWGGSAFAIVGGMIGGSYRNGASFFGVPAMWPDEPCQVVNIGYSKSNDSGQTWSNWIRPLPDWRSVPGIAGSIYDDWWNMVPDLSYFQYTFDMLVDADNHVHFFGIVEDTLTHARAIAEIFETQSGWEAKIIQPNLRTSTILYYPPNLDQTGHNQQAAINPDGTVMGLVWLDAATQGDSLTDIWFSARHISSTSWSTPQNLTQTSPRPELLLHAAPTMRSNGGNSYTLFLLRAYESGVDTFPASSSNLTVFYFASHTFISTLGAEGAAPLPAQYELEQNYPNPFNPETRIGFRIQDAGFTSLKVYDVLGREVATLVEGKIDAGNHEVTFDGSNLPSGVYVYRLMSGSYQESKKMLLIK